MFETLTNQLYCLKRFHLGSFLQKSFWSIQPNAKKWSSPLSISSANVTKSTRNCVFGQLLKKYLTENFIFCAVTYETKWVTLYTSANEKRKFWKRSVRDHSFSTYAKLFKKLIFLTLLTCNNTCAYQGVINVSFSENFSYVLNQ